MEENQSTKKKPSKQRRDKLRELNSHEYHTRRLGFSDMWWEVQRAIRDSLNFATSVSLPKLYKQNLERSLMLKTILATNFPTKSLLKMSKFCLYIFDKEDITHRSEDVGLKVF